MKTNFEIKPLPETKFGCGMIETLPEIIKRTGALKTLLIIDKNMKSKGLTRKLENLLAENSIQTHTQIVETSILDPEVLTSVLKNVQVKEFSVIIGYGGWRCIDLAKMLGIVATNCTDPCEFVGEKFSIHKRGIPVISVPTTPLNGDEINTKAIIRSPQNRQLIFIEHPFLAPILTIIDPDLMVTIPPDLTAATGIDAITHAIDALISMESSPLSEILSLQAIALLNENLVDAFRKPDNIRARYNVALGSYYAALALDMTGSGAIHALAYPLTARYGISHPQASSLLSVHVMKFNLPVVPDQFLRIARLLGCQVTGQESDAVKSLEAFEILLKTLDIPVLLSSYNIPRIDLSELVLSAELSSDCLKRNPRILEKQEILSIYQSAL